LGLGRVILFLSEFREFRVFGVLITVGLPRVPRQSGLFLHLLNFFLVVSRLTGIPTRSGT
jgi:hypothetical protein